MIEYFSNIYILVHIYKKTATLNLIFKNVCICMCMDALFVCVCTMYMPAVPTKGQKV